MLWTVERMIHSCALEKYLTVGRNHKLLHRLPERNLPNLGEHVGSPRIRIEGEFASRKNPIPIVISPRNFQGEPASADRPAASGTPCGPRARAPRGSRAPRLPSRKETTGSTMRNIAFAGFPANVHQTY